MSAAAPAAMVEGWEATRQKKRRKKHREEVEVAASSSESPRPPATPDSKTESPAPVTAETLTSTAVAAGKGRKRKKQEVAAASSLVQEAVRKEEKKKGRRSKHEAAAATPSPSIPAAAAAAATAQILEVAAASSLVEEAVRKELKKKGKRSKHEAAAAATPSQSIPAAAATVQILEVAAEGAAARKEQRRGKLEQGQSGQQPSPVDVHPHGGEAVVDGGVSGSKRVRRSSNGKPRVLTDQEILRMRIASLKEQPVPQGFVPAMANPNLIGQDPKYSSPFGAFFDQFCYRPVCRQGRNAPSLPKTPDPPSRPPPRDHPSFLSSQLTANQKAAKTTTLNTKRPPSASGSQVAVKAKEMERPDEKMGTTKKPRKKPPLLSAAEKRSDKYRRLPLNQLVPPPRSPYNLLQERYAHDPWKVIIICMLLNLSKGDQVRKKLEGFFERYPDAQTACTADPEKMAEYLAPLGLQRVKANRIHKLSKAYVEEEWTYITELCGVGKYAADAYAIFCAGRATEVVPEDHKLVDYWKYACFKLPTQASQNVEEAAGVTGQGNLAPTVQQTALSC
ncbi:hypothetical protein SEVIR_7G037400v4 [Setaria viridis]|uniref:HhH-GPD domain-containing protein n=1 Tax=Setaria viridis TaxID=4556 RepID=A0A4U6TJY5_SETVI|nr:uncharacterized protein LOC117863533 [Setaria viridis]TKW02811.1 hypothetical protein SEVIR_7G037400v2 [Setaria viridis]